MKIKIGCLLRLRNGSIELVGSVNEELGTCDCCSHIRTSPSSVLPLEHEINDELVIYIGYIGGEDKDKNENWGMNENYNLPKEGE